MQRSDSQRTFDRDGILNALWSDPIACALSPDKPPALSRGEEFLDLQYLAAGVQRAQRAMVPTGGELSRRSVEPATWDKLLGYLRVPSQVVAA